MSQWQEDLPIVAGESELWWFYGNTALERRKSKEKRLKMLRIGSNTLVYNDRFVHPLVEGWVGLWSRVTLPDLPS